MDTYYIYKASNTVNDMVYIGCTKQFKERIAQHLACRPAEDCAFHRALQEIGKDKFTFEIIDKAEGIEEGHRLEREYIKKYDSFKNGYNSTIGGFAPTPWNVRAIVCLDLDGNLIKRYESAGAAKKDGYYDSNVLECCKGIARTCLGHIFMFEDDYQQNGPRKYVKPKAANKRPIVQCDLSGNLIKRFDSISEAARDTGINRPAISLALIGRTKNVCGKYIFVYEDHFPIKDLSVFQHRKKGRRIVQVNPQTGETIKVYDRIADAGRELGVSYKAIQKVVDLEDRTAYGFKWISQYVNAEVSD